MLCSGNAMRSGARSSRLKEKNRTPAIFCLGVPQLETIGSLKIAGGVFFFFSGQLSKVGCLKWETFHSECSVV